jgi:hypothetical protein
MPESKFLLVDETRLVVVSSKNLYLVREKLAGLKAPKKLEVIID